MKDLHASFAIVNFCFVVDTECGANWLPDIMKSIVMKINTL